MRARVRMAHRRNPVLSVLPGEGIYSAFQSSAEGDQLRLELTRYLEKIGQASERTNYMPYQITFVLVSPHSSGGKARGEPIMVFAPGSFVQPGGLLLYTYSRIPPFRDLGDEGPQAALRQECLIWSLAGQLKFTGGRLTLALMQDYYCNPWWGGGKGQEDKPPQPGKKPEGGMGKPQNDFEREMGRAQDGLVKELTTFLLDWTGLVDRKMPPEQPVGQPKLEYRWVSPHPGHMKRPSDYLAQYFASQQVVTRVAEGG